MSSVTPLLVFTVLLVPVRGDTQACVKQDACTCKLADGQLLSLRSLARSDGSAAFRTQDTKFYPYEFFFNPCLPFSEGGCQNTQIAICQSLNLQLNFTCGLQTSASFVRKDGDPSSLYLKFTGTDNRYSYVKLICRNVTESTFKFVKEDPVKVFNFELSSPCACPGNPKCQHLPPVTCEQEDSCSCRMSDGSGSINFRALSHPLTPLQYHQNDSVFLYNPCVGFDVKAPSGAPVNACVDVSVCEVVDAGKPTQQNHNLGVPAGVSFHTQTNGTLSLRYKGPDDKISDVELICDRSAREFPVFEFLGLKDGVYKFSLRSVCACRGGCVSPPRTCVYVDSCSCRLDDGSGLINLRFLDNPFAPLGTTVTNEFGNVISYFYNPCSGLKLGGACSNVSACQQLHTTGSAPQVYRLGTVRPQGFVQRDDNLFMKYAGGDYQRNFEVTLVCDPDAHVPVFGNATESPLKSYHFDLRSKFACPDVYPEK